MIRFFFIALLTLLNFKNTNGYDGSNSRSISKVKVVDLDIATIIETVNSVFKNNPQTTRRVLSYALRSVSKSYAFIRSVNCGLWVQFF